MTGIRDDAIPLPGRNFSAERDFAEPSGSLAMARKDGRFIRIG